MIIFSFPVCICQYVICHMMIIQNYSTSIDYKKSIKVYFEQTKC